MNKQNPELLQTVEINPKKNPKATVIWMHGLGADGHDFEAIVPELQLPETLPIRFVFPHAPFLPVTLNGGMKMRAWYDINSLELMGHQVDTDNIQKSSQAISNLIRREIDQGMTSRQIVLAGFSQGGVIALHTGLQWPSALAGILALSTYLPTLSQLKSDRSAANQNLPIWMAHGTYDPVVALFLGSHARDGLQQLGYSVDWNEYPMLHQVCLEEIQGIRSWLLKIFSD